MTIKPNFTKNGISIYIKHGIWWNKVGALCWGKTGVSLYYWTTEYRLWSAHLSPRLLFGRQHTIGAHFGFVLTYSLGPLTFALSDVLAKKEA